MEKKIDFSGKSITTKIVYGAVIAILCITAIVIGIVGAASKSKDNTDINQPPVSDGTNNENQEPPKTEDETQQPAPLSFISPVSGTVVKEHSLEMPVFSITLGEWRVHTGIDISCEEGSGVFASEAGVVSAIYSDPMLGYTVEITHRDNIKTRYSNLSNDIGDLKVGDTVACGDRIGAVGDTSVSELAEEPHLHFEVLLKDAKVNPMDYICDESKKSSLGIKG